MERVGCTPTEHARATKREKYWISLGAPNYPQHQRISPTHEQPRVWSQEEQTIRIFYLSCRIQNLPRLCKLHRLCNWPRPVKWRDKNAVVKQNSLVDDLQQKQNTYNFPIHLNEVIIVIPIVIINIWQFFYLLLSKLINSALILFFI